MLSKFFIDRPIFATVLSVVITLTGGIALWTLPIAQYPRITPPSVNVSITYPGASAQVIADTVAAPIEQSVTGVPGMLYMSSQMGNDGTYSLSVTFDVDVDLNTALVMVQNRVTLAMPLLPTPVQNQGITIRKKTPDILCMVNFISAVKVTLMDGTVLTGTIQGNDKQKIILRNFEGKETDIPHEKIDWISEPLYDDIYLSNFALINVKDELLRVEGVSDVNLMGERDYSIRAWLDPQKLSARNMTATDVANAIGTQNIPAPIGQLGQPPMGRGQAFQLPLTTLGRLSDPADFGNIIIKVGSPLATPVPAIMAASPGSGSGDVTSPNMSPGTSPGASPSTSTMASGGATSPSMGSTIGGTDSASDSTMDDTTSDNTANYSPGSLMPAKSKSPKTLKLKMKAPTMKMATKPAPPSIPVVRLKDVARVEMGALNYNLSCTFDGGPSVGTSVYQLPGTNALDVADAVRAKMKELKKKCFPEGIDYVIAYDTAPFIRESIGEVFHTLRDAVILVAIVVLFFLQDWRAMILPMIDVPVSLIGTFAVMAAMGYSLNNISLFGLVLAIGIVVDDAIVVLENIERQMAKGLNTRTATIKAMEEISGPIMAITMVLCAVFVPCAFISGITGRFFRQFAVTIAASTIISAINALTMTPSRALMIFKTKGEKDAEARAREGEAPAEPEPRKNDTVLHGSGSAGASPSQPHASHEHHKEALPWWIFGLAGYFTARYGAELLPYIIRLTGMELPDESEDTGFISMTSMVLFVPGMLAGLVFGWFCIRPINAVLGALFRGFNRAFDWVTEIYGSIIGASLRLSAIVLLAYGGLLFLTYWVFRDAPTGFVPQQDQGRLIISVQLPDSASLARTQEVTAEVDRITRDIPGVAHTIQLCGISFVEQANAPNFGSILVILAPFDKRQDRKLRAEAIMARLRKEWAKQVTEARVVVLGASPIPGLSVAGGFKIIVEDRGGLGLDILQAQSDTLIRKVKKQIGDDAKTKPGEGEEDGQHKKQMLSGVNTQFRSNTPQLFMDIDRTKVASLGVSLDDVNQTLSIYVGSLYVNSFNEYGRYWQVTLQADKEFRSRVEDMNLLQVRNNKNQMVPLGSLMEVKEISGPIFVKRYNLYAAAPISGALLPGISSGDVISAVDQIADDSLPRSMKAEWTELMFMQIREGNTTGIVFALAVACVFLALAALYESWTLPMAVILVVPLCVLSSLVGVLYTSTSLNIFVQIGLVVLVGLACKNAILVVEFAKELHTQGKSVYDATLESARLRLRPILMTSFAFILGVVPLCLASGAGAEMRRSLGVAVFSGMLGVTAFGIFMTPVFFYVIQGVGETRLFSGAAVQWAFSLLIGGGTGGGIGYLLSMLGVVPAFWGTFIGVCMGLLAVAAVMGVHLRMKAKGS